MFEARLRESLPAVEERIASALVRAGRRDAVQIVAVTKGHPVAAVTAAARAGIAAVGENRVQELEEKRAGWTESPGLAWHLIGHLQRNKARKAVALSDLIHSVDSVRLAQELSREAERAGRVTRVLVQVNMSGEETKGGFEGEAAIDGIAGVTRLPGLVCEGLMTMAPFTDDTTLIRRTFVATRELLDRCVAEGVGLSGRQLSMGMSGDFEIAIEEGSTMVRLGTVLFGERQ
jgi:PLP dependent protein